MGNKAIRTSPVFKSEIKLKNMLDYAKKQKEHYKDYIYDSEYKYWDAKVIDLSAQLYALYFERERYDKLDTI